MSFQLHAQLQKDCHVLGRLDVSQLLLLNNALVPWFILVPETDKVELYQLDADFQQRILKEINQLSAWVDQAFEVDKLNVAMIGNKVPQMHIHVVGRHKGDYCWPGVVWAAEEKQPYEKADLGVLKQLVVEELGLSPV